MALVSPSSPATLPPEKSDPEIALPSSNQFTEIPLPSSKSTELPLPPSTQPMPPPHSTSSPSIIETPNPNPSISSQPPPSIQSISPSPIPGPPPSFRPAAVPAPVPPPASQFSPLLPNPPTLQPPGVGGVPMSIMLPGMGTGAGSVTVSVSPLRPPNMYPYATGQPPNPPPSGLYGQMPNGYASMHGAAGIPPPGIPRYPSPYAGMGRPAFPPRPPTAMGVIPPLSRPPVPGIRGVPPMVAPVMRPVVPIVAPTEKPQTTVYVGKIAATVENEFLLSLLQLCGPVKSWKRAQDPSDGSPRGFGFCEFESAEGVLRALRLLSKFSVDGQELVLNVNQATREYLERYVEKKTEREKKLKEGDAEGIEKDDESAPGVKKHEPQKPSLQDSKKDDHSADKENHDAAQKFGIVTDEDREADREASEKLTSMMEERLKTKPLPPPPPVQNDSSMKSNSEVPAKSRDGDSDVDIMKSDAAEDKNDDETTSEHKPTAEHDRPETSSSDKGRRYDRRSRERDRERDLKREKERELERYERERERERVRREREREMKVREAERLYKERVKEWESREREKDHQRMYEKEKEKEKERERRREIMDQEDESDDEDTRKRRRRSSSTYEEKRRKRQREKEDDLDDRLREEEEFAEAKRRAVEEQKQREEEVGQATNGSEKPAMPEEGISDEERENALDVTCERDSGHANHSRDAVQRNGTGDELTSGSSVADLDMRQNSGAPARKLGFGLTGSGKRTAVPSVFHEEDDEDAQKEKKMRPLVPIDYSTEEIKAVQPSVTGTPPNLVAAAEFAKRISNVNTKEERGESERERSKRSNDRSSQRERDRNDDESSRARDENKEKVHDKSLDRDRDQEHGPDKVKSLENKKLLDAKQLIDMIPKTKEELFSYDINWAVYDKHELHERMRPWISKKITEFLGEEEATLVDYIVSSTKEHVRATQMLELLQSILDDEAEMFVLKMWRMLIFEIKKVETGLSLKPRA
ncbi:RNA-binding motif protein 25 isoform X2 [Magnolia sinica]|uniref:RNA-binding motif protein 25 isoform X2 n=1 Tax=Magnolia sinica TaxID=86752 RepID=UPI0026588321|nr:RNA-binding motif protein 25 isoform X2 [Magnolia sinica]